MLGPSDYLSDENRPVKPGRLVWYPVEIMSSPDPCQTSAETASVPAVIPYESASPMPTAARPWWVWIIIGIYLLLVGGFVTVPILLASEAGDPAAGVASGTVVFIMILCGLALILTPVKAVRRRPITRRTILLPIIASGILVGGLIVGGGFAAAELASATSDPSDAALWAVIGSAVAVWIAWSVVFVILSANRNPQSLGMKLHHFLIAGSVLELLVAVPAHLVVRRRTECCAGMLTGTGICIGAAIALVSFGPSVLLLFHRRCRQIAIPVVMSGQTLSEHPSE
jgi:hypothetical protein